MLHETLYSRFGVGAPIFTNEILELFPQYTKAYVFRLLGKEIENGDIVRKGQGVYCIPEMTPLGVSTVSATKIAEKRYIESDGDIFGIYSGNVLQNSFLLTSQVANVCEIVTNRESSRRREVTIGKFSFILRRSRTEITPDNVHAYRVLQLFSERNGIEVDGKTVRYVNDYIRDQDIKRDDLVGLAAYFPAATMKKMVCLGVM